MNEKGNEYKIHMIRINNFENICFSNTIQNFESDKIHAKNDPEHITTLIPSKFIRKIYLSESAWKMFTDK